MLRVMAGDWDLQQNDSKSCCWPSMPHVHRYLSLTAVAGKIGRRIYNGNHWSEPTSFRIEVQHFTPTSPCSSTECCHFCKRIWLTAPCIWSPVWSEDMNHSSLIYISGSVYLSPWQCLCYTWNVGLSVCRDWIDSSWKSATEREPERWWIWWGWAVKPAWLSITSCSTSSFQPVCPHEPALSLAALLTAYQGYSIAGEGHKLYVLFMFI